MKRSKFNDEQILTIVKEGEPAGRSAVKPRTAADLIEQLDAAGIKRVVVPSAAYIFEE